LREARVNYPSLRAAIEAGEIADMLPSVTEIARSAGVAPGTVQRALKILRGLGTFVKRDG
jgi:DNA-binding transcriptional regulator YhcF (GntR family)